MKRKHDTIIYMSIGIIVLVFILILEFSNLKIVLDPFVMLMRGELSFEEYTSEISTGYQSEKLREKNSFIELNGLFARMTGRRVYNDTALMSNGMLTYASMSRENTDHATEELKKDYDFLKTLGIPFLYVQAPYKLPLEGNLLPKGVDNYGNDNMNRFIEGLQEYGVPTLDLRTTLSKTKNDIEHFFYRTDHHWTPDGAFLAVKTIMNEMEKVTGYKIDQQYTDKELWTRHCLEEWFLGRFGKRVGSLFAGVDPLIWYTPDFTCNLSSAYPHRNEFFKGNFETALIRPEYIEKKDYYKHNPYVLYIGGDYPLAEHRNEKAPNKQKLLLIKDSFMLPVQAFLATEFQEVDVIDPRYYTSSSIAEYIMWTQPDFVILMSSITFTDSHYYTWGVVESQPKEERSITFQMERVEVEGREKQDNYVSLFDDFTNGETYSVTFQDVTVTEGQTDAFSIAIAEKKNNEIILHQIFDISYSEQEGDMSWNIKIPEQREQNDSEYELRLYAGVAGATEQIGLEISNLILYQLN